jgi:4-oxalomesaconate hydratase
MSQVKQAALVVSAHSADFVWRAGGAIALHAALGYTMKVVCLSYGERGESAKLWRKGNMTLDEVKRVRRAEAEKAAQILGAAIEFWDLGDYPMRIDDSVVRRMADLYRALRPAFVLSHSIKDPYNLDHPLATHLAQEARIVAQAHGYRPEAPVIGAPPVYLFEPHQTEQCEWRPDILLDITTVWERKKQAIEAMEGQEHLWEYYTRVALQRGVQAARNSDRKVTYGEGYQRLFPHVTGALA